MKKTMFLAIALSLLLCATSFAQDDLWYFNPANGHYYRLTDPMPWVGAEAQAVAWGGHLVTLDNAEEELWVKDTFGRSEHFWIGFNDIEEEGNWVWSSGASITYTNWDLSEPNNCCFCTPDPGCEDAAIMNWAVDVGSGPFGDYWNDVGPDGGRRGIVERSGTLFIDINPGSDPNSINLTSGGVISVAIITTEDFDATTMDPLSVEFGPSGATESHGRGHIEDVDGDGDMDLLLHFKTQETGIQCGDTAASLRGRTIDFSVISTDFEAGFPSEFSGYGSLTATQGYSAHGFGATFLRNDSWPAEATILTLSGLPAHDSISLNFLAGMINTWDGENGTDIWGPDFFNVAVDGVEIFGETIDAYENQNNPYGRQSYIPPMGVALSFGTNLGWQQNVPDIAYNMGLDPTFDNISHSASTLTIQWFADGEGWQGGMDESWAIDNIEVLVSQEVDGSDLINVIGCE